MHNGRLVYVQAQARRQTGRAVAVPVRPRAPLQLIHVPARAPPRPRHGSRLATRWEGSRPRANARLRRARVRSYAAPAGQRRGGTTAAAQSQLRRAVPKHRPGRCTLAESLRKQLRCAVVQTVAGRPASLPSGHCTRRQSRRAQLRHAGRPNDADQQPVSRACARSHNAPSPNTGRAAKTR